MSRFLLALRCFFAVLLRFRLPPDAVALLPPPDPEALGGAPPKSLPGPSEVAPEPPRPAPPQPAAQPAPRIEVKPVESAPAPPSPPQGAEVGDEQRQALRHRGAVQILSVLQREGRLLDFLFEDIDSYADAQIGAAVRDIHRSCKKALREHMSIAPIRPEPDEAVVRIPAGHDASQIRLVGNVTGRPPFEGTLRHHGWRTTRIQLSDTPAGHDPSVIAPAEVEIGA